MSSGKSTGGTSLQDLKKRLDEKRNRKRSNKSVNNEPDVNVGMEMGPVAPWYWANYYKSLMWQNKYEIALWKSYAAALECERAYLLQQLQKLGGEQSTYAAFPPDQPILIPPEPQTEQKKEKKSAKKEEKKSKEEEKKGKEEVKKGKEEEEEFEIVASDEMMEYFRKSFKRKLRMKKQMEKEKEEQKKKEAEQYELDAKQLKEAHELREKEMKLLYGEKSCMIIGMETAVQLSYDKYCDLKSPYYWPNIPLNL